MKPTEGEQSKDESRVAGNERQIAHLGLARGADAEQQRDLGDPASARDKRNGDLKLRFEAASPQAKPTDGGFSVGTEASRQIADSGGEQSAEDRVGRPRDDGPVQRHSDHSASPHIAAREHGVRGRAASHQSGDQLERMTEVGVEGDDDVAASGSEPRREGGAHPQIRTMRDGSEQRMSFAQARKDLSGSIGGSVIDDKNLVLSADGSQRRRDEQLDHGRLVERGREHGQTGHAAVSAHGGPKRFWWRNLQRMSWERSEIPLFASILIVGAAIRLFWVIALPVLPESDFQTFYDMARLIGTGHWWPDSYGWQFQGPGYPLVLAPFSLVGDGLGPIRAANVLMQLGTIACAWWLARRLFGVPVASVTAFVVALFPGLWEYSSLVAAENIAMLLLTALAALLAGARIAGTRDRKQLLLLGVLACLLAFARPAYLFFLPLVGIAIIWDARAAWRHHAAWYLLGVLAVFAPIAQANLAQGGSLLPLANAGYQLWLVSNEKAEGHWFPADQEDDYPFRGLMGPEDPAGGFAFGGEISAAQQKLAFQFVAANPGAAAVGLGIRHQINWATDGQGLAATVGRAAPEWLQRVPPISMLAGLTANYHAAVVALALLGALRLRRRADVLRTLIMPLGYVLLIYLPAAAGDRLHTPALPLLAVLAVAGVASAPAAVLVAAVSLCAATFLAPMAAAVLIWPIVVVPLLCQAVPWVAARARAFAARSRRALGVAALGALLVPVVGVVAIHDAAIGAVAEIAAAAPEGWDGYQMRGGAQQPVALLLRPSPAPAGLVKVSYPDAAVLHFSDTPRSGDVIGARRRFTGLESGKSYRFYVQIYDPAVSGEQLTVVVDGHVVWTGGGMSDTGAGWHYISLPWRTEDDSVSVDVERRAGTELGANQSADVLIRSVHLYQKY